MGSWRVGGTAQAFYLEGEDTTANPVAVATDTASNSKGAWVALTTSTAFDATAITVCIPYISQAHDFLVDIGVGGAGSEEVLLANLSVSRGGAAGDTPTFAQRFPISVPAGTRVSARAQTSSYVSSDYVRCGVIIEQSMVPAGGQLVTVGANTADSGGVAVSSGGSAQTKGSWTEITAATTADFKKVFFSFGNRDNSSRGEDYINMDVAVGGSGSEEIIIPDLGISSGALTVNGMLHPAHTHFYDISIPSGTRVAVRTACTFSSSAPDNVIDVIMYGLT